MQGLMQDVPLTIHLILRRAVQQGHGLHDASAGADGVRRMAWSEVGDRALRLADRSTASARLATVLESARTPIEQGATR